MLLVLSMLATTFPVWAQETSLPPICTENAGMVGHDMGTMAPEGDAPANDLMAGMDKMNADMMIGATASDLDVAFICSMIPHHQGAIDMAKAELASGDDPWARELAETIIAAQESEIAAMLEWLETAGK
jgi:uncharacterized protein (DUF305 family)